jgi:hypothetical protein
LETKTGECREGGKDINGIKEKKKEDEGLRHE